MNELIIRGGRLAGEDSAVDVHITDGVITRVSPSGAQDSDQAAGAVVVDAVGCIVMPSFIDLHTHTREPGKPQAEDAQTASAAAAAGGYGVIHAMANTTPVADTPEAMDVVWRRGRELGLVDIRPVGAVTRGLAGQELAPIAAMHDTQAQPTLFSDDGHCVDRADLMRAALREVARFGGVIAQHAQESTLTAGAQANEGEVAKQLGLPGWPGVAEAAIVARDVLLAADTGSRLHVCHVSTAATVEVLRWAKSRGVQVTAEVTPHHLILTDELITTGDAVYKVNPPLRSEADVVAVREALADGTIDAVATDHAPHEDSAKSCAWSAAAMGMTGLETALGVVWLTMVQTGLIDESRLIEVMSYAPARIGSLTTPVIAEGAPARLTVIDPSATWSVDPSRSLSRSRNTPFAGHTLPVTIRATVHDGVVTYARERSNA